MTAGELSNYDSVLWPVWRLPVRRPATYTSIPIFVSRPAIPFAAIRERRVALIVVPATIPVRIIAGQITWHARCALPIIAGTDSDVPAVDPCTALVHRRPPARHRRVGAVSDDRGNKSQGQHKHHWEYPNKLFHSRSLSMYIIFVPYIYVEYLFLP